MTRTRRAPAGGQCVAFVAQGGHKWRCTREAHHVDALHVNEEGGVEWTDAPRAAAPAKEIDPGSLEFCRELRADPVYDLLVRLESSLVGGRELLMHYCGKFAAARVEIHRLQERSRPK